MAAGGRQDRRGGWVGCRPGFCGRLCFAWLSGPALSCAVQQQKWRWAQVECVQILLQVVQYQRWQLAAGAGQRCGAGRCQSLPFPPPELPCTAAFAASMAPAGRHAAMQACRHAASAPPACWLHACPAVLRRTACPSPVRGAYWLAGQGWQLCASVSHVLTRGVRTAEDVIMLLGSPVHELKVPMLQATISERRSTVRPSATSASVRSALVRSR